MNNFLFQLKKLSNPFIVIGFIIYIGGGVQLLIMLRNAEGFTNLEGDLPSQLIYLSVYAATCILLLLSVRRISLGIVKNILFWLLLAWTFLSIFWSGSQWVTFRHVIALCGTTLFSVYLVNHLDIQKYIKLLAISLLLINIASYLAIFLLPDIGIGHVVTSEWKGIFTHKNHLGKAASLSILIFFYLLLKENKWRWVWLLGLFSSICLVLGSQSAAAIMISVCILAVIGAAYLLEKMPIVLLVMFLTTLVILVISPLPKPSQILKYLGKDETLTGRTQLWEFSLHMVSKKPLQGYGYGAFWLGSKGPSAYAWEGMPMGMEITHSHNGFIEVLLGIGIVGLFFLSITYSRAMMRAIGYFFRNNFKFEYSIYIIILLWILPYNISELALFDRNNIFWVLFSSMVLYQAKERS